jgi:hypothetical protein
MRTCEVKEKVLETTIAQDAELVAVRDEQSRKDNGIAALTHRISELENQRCMLGYGFAVCVLMCLLCFLLAVLLPQFKYLCNLVSCVLFL